MVLDILLVIVFIICCTTDLMVRKIYNVVIFPFLLLTFLLHFILGGLSGLGASLLGFVSGIAILIIPFSLGGIGAGDVKLLALIGAIKGSVFAVNTALYMFVIGGVIALIKIASHRETINFLKSLSGFLAGAVRGNYCKLEFPTTPFLKKFPYSTAIAGGALINLIFKGAVSL